MLKVAFSFLFYTYLNLRYVFASVLKFRFNEGVCLMLIRKQDCLFLMVFLSLFLACSPLAKAQQFKKLTATSLYACIKFPNGKTGVGKAAKDGYATRSFPAASQEISSKLGAQRDALKAKQELINDVMKDNDISKSDFDKIISGGFAIGLPDRIKQSTATKLIKLNQAVNATRVKISEYQAELKALDACKKGKTDFTYNLPAQGGAILGTSANGVAGIGVYIIVEDTNRNSPLDTRLFYCAKGLTKSSSTGGIYVLRSARRDPCAESALKAFDIRSCPTPAGQLFILVGTAILPSSEPIGLASAIEGLNQTYQDTYSLKAISENPNSPCGYLN